MRMNGVTVFFTKPGEADGILCKVCGTECVVDRNIMGPTCFAAAMGGHKSLHDRAECPHSNAEWHDEAYALWKELGETHSNRVRALIEADLIEVLEANGKSWLPERPI